MNFSKLLLFIVLSFSFLCAPSFDLSAKQHKQHKTHAAHKSHKQGTQKKSPYVGKNNYEQFWHKSTFPTQTASIKYHTQKHGNGRDSLAYTRDAVNFYHKNKKLKQPFTLKDGTKGYKIKKGTDGGTWTKDGKVVTYWG